MKTRNSLAPSCYSKATTDYIYRCIDKYRQDTTKSRDVLKSVPRRNNFKRHNTRSNKTHPEHSVRNQVSWATHFAKDRRRCAGCGSSEESFQINYEDDTRVCTTCGTVDPVSVGIEWDPFHYRSVYKPHTTKGRSSPYNHNFYSNERLTQANATDPRVPPVLIYYIKKAGNILTGGDNRLLSRERIRRLCKLFGSPESAERWWQIYKRVNSLHASEKQMPGSVLYWLKKSFEYYRSSMKHMINHKLFKNRKSKNLLNYNYVYRQLLLIHDYIYDTNWEESERWRFKLVKTPKRLQKCNEDWSEVVHFMNAGLLDSGNNNNDDNNIKDEIPCFILTNNNK